MGCGFSCEAAAECHSFTACPGDHLCLLKRRAVYKGDAHINVNASCQTYIRMDCSETNSTQEPNSTEELTHSGQVPPLFTPAPTPELIATPTPILVDTQTNFTQEPNSTEEFTPSEWVPRHRDLSATTTIGSFLEPSGARSRPTPEWAISVLAMTSAVVLTTN